jgi:DNA-binding NarL/FixJ family response regulator
MTVRVILVDDHASVLDTLPTLLRGADDVTVVARCEPGSGEWGSDALATILDRQTDAILLDLRAPVMDRLGVLREIDGRGLDARVVILLGAVDESAILEIARLRLHGAAYEGPRPRPRGGPRSQDRELRVSESSANGAATLTTRELDIVRAVTRGLRNKAIAAKLRVAEGTVKVHLHNIYKKLGLDSRLALMVYSKEQSLT